MRKALAFLFILLLVAVSVCGCDLFEKACSRAKKECARFLVKPKMN